MKLDLIKVYIYGAGADYAVQETASVELAFTDTIDSDSLYARFGKRCTNLISTLEELGIVNETWHLYTHEEYNMLELDEK